jgi:BirA family transcriptional regulator, biotin operon repressor / biotin---[acetyl-CoA-carboxylase] ligase
MPAQLPPFDPDAFQAQLRPHDLGHTTIATLTTGSTNDDAKKAGRQGFPSGSLFITEHQSTGRGRRGSHWEAPAGSSILCSLLLRPSMPIEQWSRCGHALALAIALSLEAQGTSPAVKWPNDIYLSGKKLCGMLLETECQGTDGFLVAGFGLNVHGAHTDFPLALRGSLTTLEAQTHRPISRESLLASICNHLHSTLEQAKNDFPSLLDALWARSWLKNQSISLHAEGAQLKGKALGLSPLGGLLVQLPCGTIQEFLAADLVRIL